MGKKSKKNKSRHGHTSNGGHKKSEGSSSSWEIGDRVVICGLKQATRFNGKTATIISQPKDSGTRYGVSVDGQNIAVLPSNLESPTKSANEHSYNIEEKLHEEEERNSADADSLAAIRLMMNMFMTEEHQIKIFGRKIKPLPDFGDELRNEGGGFPIGVNSKWANRYLRTAFEQSSLLPHTHEMHFKSEDYKPSSTDIMRRMRANSRAKFDWFCQPRKLGDIFPQMSDPYSSNVRHSYSNQAYRKEVLLFGTTHVAVGFVDLGILLEADFNGPPKLGMIGPLCFFGIERSPYAVAKALVVWEMIRQSQHDDHIRYVMQVWYSTTFEAEAEQYLKKVLFVLCDSDEKRHPAVDVLLQHWRDAGKMSLETARSKWANGTTNSHSYIGHLERKRDRIDMVKYELTGDFGIENDGKPLSGNIIMFDCPEGTPPLPRNETVFSAISWEAITSFLSPSITVFEACQKIIMERISKVAHWARLGMVTTQFVCEDVQNVTGLIASKKPWTMSWSNVLDYMDYADFHQLARACSIHGDTLHCGYSMNWPKDVFGVQIIDFSRKDQTELRRGLIESANQSIEMQYKFFGWDKYLRLPPPTNPINTTSPGLEIGQYVNWANHFFDIGRCQGPCQVGNIEHALGSPLSPTGSSTVYLTWTYDPEIKFSPKFNKY